jgi:alpha-L-rhamnosidase
VKIAGLDNESIRKLEALQISENNEQVSSFQCSNPLLNKIWEAVNNTYRCINYSGYVVDCPHRERFGYGGDSHSSMEAALSNFDLAALFNKWTLDWNSGNYPNGLWPHTVPENPNHKNKFSPGWGGFGMFLPWQFYIYYGDTTNLSRAYPYIKQWMSYLQTNVHNGILKKDTLREISTKWSFHGDWVAPYYGMQPENRVDQLSTKFFNNCFYLYELQMARNIANVLGKTDDAEYYDKLFQKSKLIIHNTFFNPGLGYYANGEQPYQAFPLLVELVPDELKTEIEDYLEYLILEKNNGHLNSGMLGTYFLLEYLMKAGRHDLIYTMVNQKTFPGWGYMVENGATTIWEQWNGENSQIHNCYLAVGKWFIQGLGGIQPNHEKSGFKNFVIYPGFVEDLNSVEVSYKTRFGEIISSWKQDERKIEHKVVVPVNAVAAYQLPDIEFRQILINGKELDESEVIQLTPGEYEIHLIKK